MFKEPSLNNLDTKTNLTHPDLKPEVLTYVNSLMLEADRLAIEINDLKQKPKTNETIKQDTELKRRLTTILNLIIKSRESNEIELEELEEKEKEFTSDHIINLSSYPYVPENFSLEEHVGEGLFEFSPNNVSLYLSGKQNGGIKGDELREVLVGEPVLNANVLDYLLAHQELIPESWKGKELYFWGTIYCHHNEGLCVRCLYWDDSKWSSIFGWLDVKFYPKSPAVLARRF